MVSAPLFSRTIRFQATAAWCTGRGYNMAVHRTRGTFGAREPAMLLQARHRKHPQKIADFFHESFLSRSDPPTGGASRNAIVLPHLPNQNVRRPKEEARVHRRVWRRRARRNDFHANRV